MTLEHVVRPAAVEGARPPPLVVLLHGLGADEHDLFGLAPWLDPRAVVVSARAPMEAVPMGHSWFDIDWSVSPPRLDHRHVQEHRELVLRFAGEAARDLGADPGRTWLVGFSQGATMAAACAVHRPDRLRGIVAHSGRIVRRVMPAPPVPALAGFPVLWQHGTGDPVVPVEFGREACELLGELGMQVDACEYPIGHEISEQGLLDMAGWLTARIDESERG